MARVNVDECWWSDPRRSALIRHVGDEDIADGVMVKAWRVSQEYWKNGRRLLPLPVFKLLRHHQFILEVGLAKIIDDEFVHVSGTADHAEYLAKKAEAGKLGGAASAASRSRNHSGKIQAPVKHSSSTLKHFEPSSSSSSSSSVKKQEKEEESTEVENPPLVPVSNLGGHVLEEFKREIKVEALFRARSVKPHVQQLWLETYPDPDWLCREVVKAINWAAINPRKAPKKWDAFLNNWFDRGWEKYRKTIPSATPGAFDEPVRPIKTIEDLEKETT